jgi:hypothetical protein
LGVLVGIDVDILFICIRELINANAAEVLIKYYLEIAKSTDYLISNFELLFVGFFGADSV